MVRLTKLALGVVRRKKPLLMAFLSLFLSSALSAVIRGLKAPMVPFGFQLSSFPDFISSKEVKRIIYLSLFYDFILISIGS